MQILEKLKTQMHSVRLGDYGSLQDDGVALLSGRFIVSSSGTGTLISIQLFHFFKLSVLFTGVGYFRQ